MDTKQATHIYEDTFFIIPRYIRKLPGLTLAYLDVYETIFQFWNKNKDCFLGENALWLQKSDYLSRFEIL